MSKEDDKLNESTKELFHRQIAPKGESREIIRNIKEIQPPDKWPDPPSESEGSDE